MLHMWRDEQDWFHDHCHSSGVRAWHFVFRTCYLSIRDLVVRIILRGCEQFQCSVHKLNFCGLCIPSSVVEAFSRTLRNKSYSYFYCVDGNCRLFSVCHSQLSRLCLLSSSYGKQKLSHYVDPVVIIIKISAVCRHITSQFRCQSSFCDHLNASSFPICYVPSPLFRPSLVPITSVGFVEDA